MRTVGVRTYNIVGSGLHGLPLGSEHRWATWGDWAVRIAGPSKVGPIAQDLVGELAVLRTPGSSGTRVERPEGVFNVIETEGTEIGGAVRITKGAKG